MIVVDASALMEFLLQTPLGARVEARLFRDGDELQTAKRFLSPALNRRWTTASGT